MTELIMISYLHTGGLTTLFIRVLAILAYHPRGCAFIASYYLGTSMITYTAFTTLQLRLRIHINYIEMNVYDISVAMCMGNEVA